jgi:acyl carrier protein
MDMESDLGIDSIKRVEILGAMQTRYPDLPKLKPEELAELRTLAQIIEHMGAAVAPVSQTAAASVLSAAPSVEKSAPSVEASVLSVPASAGPDLSAITQTMLEIVSEKTGYPVETLEPGMDMESDLGIDSIKRVEILGAMQTRYPDLPKLKPEELAELRTLAQIIEHMGAAVAPTSADLAPAPVVPVVVPTSVSVLPASVAVPVSVPSVPESVLAPDLSAITQTMLEIVSEKTGYPVETLEPGMDMESDLGIDSIKRVEILGAMQTRYPELPKLKPEELAELRTLAQIIEHMGAAVAPASAGLAPTEVVVTPVDVPSALPASVLSVTRSVPASVAPVIPDAPRVLRSAVRLKALPFPDVLEANLPAGFIALLTNDGTPATTKLANALTERGWPVVVMNFPQAVVNALNTLPVHIPQVTLPELGEATLAQMLKTVEAQYGRIGAFIHLNPESSAASASPFVESEKAIVKEVFLMAKHLKESLAAAASAGRSYFVTVARLDGEFGLGATGSFGAISGGLFGLTKTLSREWQAVYCRALDLVPHLDTDRAVQYILAELQDPNRLLTEVAYGLRGRTTLVGENE